MRTKKSRALWMAALPLVLGGLVATQTASSAASMHCTERVGGMLPGGPGHSGTIYAGTWTCGDVIGFCGDFSLHNPNGAGGTSVLHSMPHMTALKSAEFAIINHEYRLTTDKLLAAEAAYAEWKLRGGSDFNTYNHWAVSHNLFASFRKASQKMIDRAHLLADPKLSVNLKPSYTGDTKTDYVQNTGTGGKPIPGMRNHLSVNANGKLSRTSGTSNAKGHTPFGLTKSDLGTVTVHASAQVVDVHYIVSTVPTIGEQHIFAVPRVKTISAVASFNKKLNAPTVSSVCDTSCNGNAKLAVHFCNPKGAATWTYFGHDQNGHLVMTFNVGGGDCKTKHFTMHDGDELHGSYCLSRGGVCFTKKTDYGHVYKVKCPHGVKVYEGSGCDCTGLLKYTILVQQLEDIRSYKVVITDVDTKTTETHTLAMGDNNYTPKGVKAGDHISISVTAYDKSTGKAMKTWPFSDVVSSPTAA
jgi:hypothetical protein